MEQENLVVHTVPSPINDDPNEIYEECISQMKKWLSLVYPKSKVDRALKVEYVETNGSNVRKLFLKSKIWTLNNQYSIAATIHIGNLPGYLGCVAIARKERPGETWSRGSDLADGDFNENTWNKIILSIVKYEAEEVKSEKWKDYPRIC